MENTKRIKNSMVHPHHSVTKLNPLPISLKIEENKINFVEKTTRKPSKNLEKMRNFIFSSFKNIVVMIFHFFRKGFHGDGISFNGNNKYIGNKNFKSKTALIESDNNSIKQSFIKFIRKLIIVQKAIMFFIDRSPFRQIKYLNTRDFSLISDKTYYVGTNTKNKTLMTPHTGVFKKTFRKIRRFSRKSCSQMRLFLRKIFF